MAGVDGDGEAGGSGREGACGAGDGLLAIVDDLDVALGIGVDEACDLSGEVEDEIGKARGVATDRERGSGVLDVAAKVALGIDDLQAAGGGAVGRNRDHDAVGEQAWRDGTIGEGERGKFIGEKIIAMARGETEGGKSDPGARESWGAGGLGKEELGKGTSYG